MKRDMSRILTRIFTMLMLAMVSTGAWADVKVVYGEKGEEKFTGSGGTIEATDQSKPDANDQVTITLTVAPADGYTISKSNIEVYATISPNATRGETPQISGKLTLEGKDPSDLSQKRDYTVTLKSTLGLWIKKAEFVSGSKGPNRSLSTNLGYSGTYYIRSEGKNASADNKYYLCPTEDWYFYNATNSYVESDNGKPFLTTYKCKDNGSYNTSKAVWTLVKHPTEENCYYIIQKHTGKYMISNGQISGSSSARRMRVHLETVANEDALSALGDLALFEITSYPADNTLNTSHLRIVPHSSTGRNGTSEIYLVVNNGNYDALTAQTLQTGGKNDGPNGTFGKATDGIIGVYSYEQNAGWNLEDYITRPNIAYNSSGLVEITAAQTSGTITIKYTTDGTIPTASNGNTYENPFDLADNQTTVQAIAIVNGEESNVAVFTPVVHAGSSHVRLIQSQNNWWIVDESTTDFHFYMIPGDEDNSIIKVNTTSLFRPSMEWYFLGAGVENGVQYYYIVNNSAKDNSNNPYYLCYDGTNVCMLTYDSNDANKYKFSIVESATAGTYLIKPYGQSNYLNKNTSNANANPINLNNSTTIENVRWAFVLPSDLDKTAPFAASDATTSRYYKIASVGSNGYYIVPPSGTATNATTSNVSAENMKWYFEVAADESDWLTYYYIRNAVTREYLYFTKDANNAGACLEMRSAIEEGSEDRYMFTWAKTADTNVNYYIIPKNLKDISQNQFSALQRDGSTLKTNLTRGAGNYAWTFETSTFKCETPVLTYDPLTGKISITCGTAGATIYMARYDSEPSSDDVPELIADNKYNGEFDAQPGYYKAVASRSTGGEDVSDAATSDLIEEFHCTRPIITKQSNHVTITCATPGATIYYIAGTGEFSENAENYGGTEYDPETGFDTSETVIKAIAIKGGVWSTKSAEALYNKTPMTITSGTEITNMDGVYIVGDSFTPSSTPIGSATDPFTGEFDGNFKAFELSHPLFAYVNGATIKNVILDNVSISSGTNVGAICNEATGDTRIYNCGVLATDSEVKTDDDGYTEITSCSSTISGSGFVGGIVGLLGGSSRVINCFSYANITAGNLVGGIVGKNNVATTSSNLQTMVMNCMFYGDITGGTSKAPIYNGEIITNRSDQNGVSNFNYFWAGASYVQGQHIDVYNCALSAETRFLQRFEFFRPLLNSNRQLAAWWATGSRDNKDEMMKWVMEPSQIGSTTPFPILKAPKDGNGLTIKYPSVVNIDADHAEEFSNSEEIKKTQYNQGRKFDVNFTINIRMGTSGDDGYHPAKDAAITTEKVYPNITDKDPAHFNFNYYKVQLPYYNDVGTNNYRKDDSGTSRVVTGWKIVGTSDNTFSTGSDASATVDANGDIALTTPYNFANRKSIDKDLYSVSGRVFNQGAYFDVPEGVTSITIEPYWAKCVYVADAYPDVVYNENMSSASSAKTVGTISENAWYTNGNPYSINGENQAVYTSMVNAAAQMPTSGNVYDNAIVLVGNVHSLDLSDKTVSKHYTIMSIDLDKDNEPDYSYILRFNGRIRVHPVRVDFLNVIGLGMAQKSTGGKGTYNLGIMQPLEWFECTNTGLFRVTQFEYDRAPRTSAPMILHGGVIEQWVTVAETTGNVTEANAVDYYHLGSNVWFKEFHIGAHQDRQQIISPHPPISVTGGDFDEFYLTGLYNTPNSNYQDNAECYINGGRFGKVAGTGMQGLGRTTNNTGDIIWQIDNADIDEFYAGGINAAHIATGNIYTVITNSRVDQFCGGPKFGDMNSNKKVVTNAKKCTFRTFFGAGYGGNSYNRRYPTNKYNDYNYGWNSWLTGDASYDYSYSGNGTNEFGGVETRIDYQFIPKSDNDKNVARLFIDYVSFSLATTYDVTSILDNCTITKSPLGRLDLFEQCLGNFYGGGSLGKVAGPVNSTLTNCTVEGNVYGAGYSASTPKVGVMDNSFQKQPHYDENLGAYLEAKLPATTPYTWEHRDVVNNDATAIDKTNHILYTSEDLTALGKVTGTATLNIEGTTTVAGNVYGGGEESNVSGNTNVYICAVQDTNDPTKYSPVDGTPVITGDVFGGGKGLTDSFTCDKAMVGVGGDNNGSVDITAESVNKGTKVIIGNGTVNGTVYGGGEVGRVEWNTVVKVGLPTGTSAPVIRKDVFGAGKGVEQYGYAALVRGNTFVTIQGDAKVGLSVYGGGEIASVGKYNIVKEEDLTEAFIAEHPELEVGMPWSLANQGSGYCNVTIRGNAEIGPDYMKMTSPGGPDDAGHVFGAGKGILPYEKEEDFDCQLADPNHAGKKHPGRMAPGNVWECYEGHEDAYLKFIEPQALATQTYVTIDGNAFVKGSVYGGSMNGHVQHDTQVTIAGGQIGCTKNTTGRIDDAVWGNDYTVTSDLECDSWPFEGDHLPYDIYKDSNGDGTPDFATDGHTFYGNVFGGGSGYYPYKRNPNYTNAMAEQGYGDGLWHREAGSVGGNTVVNITGGHILTSVYGGNEQTDVGTYIEDGNGVRTVLSGGKCTINMTGGTVGVPRTHEQMRNHPVTCYVFGAGKGDQRINFNTWTNVASTQVNISGSARIYGSTFGGGEDGHVLGDAETNISEGTNVTIGTGESATTLRYPYIGTTGTSAVDGNIFGGGRGFSETALTAGVVGGNVEVNISDGTILGSVFGGGRLASVGTFFADETNSNYGKMQEDEGNVTHGHIKINISGGSIGAVDGSGNLKNSNYTIGDVFGGCKGSSNNNADSHKFGLAKNTEITISGTAKINRSVFGGGEAGNVTGHVTVTLEGGTVGEDVYGGGALADTNIANWDFDESKNTWAENKTSASNTTTVNLYGGTIKGDAFGGGLGQKTGFNGADSDIEATTYGDITVNLGKEDKSSATAFNITYDNSGTADAPVQVVNSGRVFGTNNLNGSPKGNVTVNVYKTVKGNVDRTEGDPDNTKQANRNATDHTYQVAAVYGGGNLADYATAGKKATVIIHTCDVSVQDVYGGGNAAKVPETDVLVKGAWEIDHVFGGGNGKDKYKKGNAWIENAGADVTGNTNTLMIGGYIHEAYGGSNEKGTIGGNVYLNTNAEDDRCDCSLELEKIVGAGKNAEVWGDIITVLGCQPETLVPEYIGGADNADVHGNVELTITSGTFGKVFGGNNIGGVIEGHIKVNIEETGCRPIVIGELYGCGNDAAYSVYGYNADGTCKTEGTKIYADPEVNVISCTSIGKVFGGGLGEHATVYGNPTVNINQIYGKAYSDANKTKYDAVATSLGEIGDVFGGGNEANVVGNTHVNIGTVPKVTLTSVHDNASTEIKENEANVIGANITGNVYGGGNKANVTGNTNVNIGKAITTTP